MSASAATIVSTLVGICRHYSIHIYNPVVPHGVVDDTNIPSDDDLFDVMELQNPWWAGGGVPDESRHKFKRADYTEMRRRLDDEDYHHHVHALIGARRVGKTTVLYQLVEDLISGGDPKRVMFLTLDEDALFPSTKNLRRMLDLYSRRILREPRRRPASRAYVILDEIQVVKNWQIVIKNLVDRRSLFTIVISGSSSADLFGTSKPLLGRIRHQAMLPMSFAEYESFRGRPYAATLSATGARMRDIFAGSVADGDPVTFHECVKESLEELALAKSDILLDLSEYMTYGGCPGIVATQSHGGKMAQLKMHLRLSLYQDIVKVGRVRYPRMLGPLFVLLAKRSPRLINKERLARQLGINKATLDAYLDLLQAAYLVSYSDMYAPVRARTEKKVYVNDAGMRNTAASRAYVDSLSDSAETGLLAESIAGDHTRRLWAALDPAALPEMPYYWRDGRGREVDLVVDLRSKPVPIEVKYRRHVRASDLGGLSGFAGRFGSKVALAITQDELGMPGGGAVMVPLWLYLAMCP